ncbi:GDSL-type esterase/lipase family protein [Lewinella sp. IMCC34191]|uniref:GDSL-type esterase/lipase family protein n=1 Tax=Lewinella sp. IMCC34191 TaxID=2259172 RepID=UPI001300B2E1|nr:GDSL-type esterase/lipase family protein [Lewinella sp. IMCC34191]
MQRRYFTLLIGLCCLFATSRMAAQMQDTILIDFGDNLSAAPWNNLVDANAGAIEVLTNTLGDPTRYGIAVTDAFRDINRGGTTEPTGDLQLPATATGDSFFGNGEEWTGSVEARGAVTLTNLQADKEYDLTLFASRTGTQTRETRYIVIGASRDTVLLNAGGNTGDVVRSTMTPGTENTIVIEVEAGDNNDTAEDFFYLGALIVNYDMEEPPPVAEVEADTFLLDFGTTPSPSPWNNVTSFDSGAMVTLMNQVGAETDVRLTVVDAFRGVNTAGTTTPDEDLGFPASATGDSFFGNTGDFNGEMQPTAGVRLSGLDPRMGYTFRIFASRVSTENREAMYVLDGVMSDTVYLNAGDNTGDVAMATVFPGRDSTLTISVSPGPNNENSLGFYYLGAMEIYGEEMAVATLDTVIVDFGSSTNTTPAPYNNITDPNAGTVTDLTNTAGFYTGYSIAVVDSFNNINTDGTASPDEGLELAGSATGDSFFGNIGEFGGQVQPSAAVELDGLDPMVTYSVELFASRATSELRETRYVVEGATVDTLYLNISSNTSRTVMADMQPDETGRILVTASSGPNNQNSLGFYYLGVLRLIYPDMDPAGAAELMLTNPNGGEYWQAGKTADITWMSRNLEEVGLEYSTDNGTNWTVIDTVAAVGGMYAWTVPNEDTDEALIRITSDTLLDTSDSTFTISSDTTTCTIVVIGSSTAEGTGASSQDSSWVGRYRAYLADDTRYEVVNLARGGYTTYHILPTGSEIPAGVGIVPDLNRNVTEALTYDPFAIIVNMPSNDAARGFTPEAQLENFAAIANAAREEGTMIYIATTQPRNFPETARVDDQIEVRDSILKIYGDMAIDFWTGIADENGFIIDSLDSGDGVHLNDGGHRILYERVLGLMLDTVDCSGPSAIREAPKRVSGLVKAYPNPAESGFLMLNFSEGVRGTADVQVIDVLGRVRLRDRMQISGGADHRLDISQISGRGQNSFFVIVTVEQADGYVRDVLPVLIR